MTESEFAEFIADGLENLFGTDDFDHIQVDGPHIYILLGPRFPANRGDQMTLLVIDESQG